MMKLTRREKYLLYLSGITILLAVGVIRILLPSYEKYAAAREAYEAALSEEESRQRRLSYVAELEENREERQLQYQQWRDMLPEPMDNDAVESLVLGYFTGRHLEPVKTFIHSNETVQLEPEAYSELQLEGSAEAVIARLSVEALGTSEDFFMLVRELSGIRHLRIDSFQAETTGTDQQLRFLVEISCYMLEALNDE